MSRQKRLSSIPDTGTCQALIGIFQQNGDLKSNSQPCTAPMLSMYANLQRRLPGSLPHCKQPVLDLKKAKKDGAERAVSAACRSASRRASSARTTAAQWSMLSTDAPVPPPRSHQ